MRRIGTIRQIVALATIVGGATLASSAQEPAASASTPRPVAPPDAIAKAKKDFDALKSTRDSPQQPRSSAPELSMPEWQAGAPSVGIGTVQKKPIRDPKDAKSSNWLAEAMEKSSSTRAGRTKGGERRGDQRDVLTNADGRAEDPSRQTDTTEGERGSRAADEAADKERKSTVGAVNPLGRYLGEWMTPQDYAVLKPSITESLGTASDVRATAVPGLGTLGNGTSAIGGESLLGNIGPVRPSFTPPVPRENPYLASVGAAPETSSQIFAARPNSVSSPAPVFRAPTIAPPPPPISPSAPKVPDFAKPSSDEKYFKQLKRF